MFAISLILWLEYLREVSNMMLATMMIIFIIKSFFAFQAKSKMVGAFVMPHGKQ